MSQPNVEVVRLCCDAFRRGDYGSALDALAIADQSLADRVVFLERTDRA